MYNKCYKHSVYSSRNVESSSGKSAKMFWCHIIIFLLAVGNHWNSLSGDFVHDDIVAIVRNPDVNPKKIYQSSPSESGEWWSLWKNDYWGMPMSSPNSHKSYRPLTVLTFRLNYWMCGDTLCPELFHGTNVLIHGLVSTLMLYLCRHVLQLKLTTSLLASASFAIHPIHTEAVAGITGRADALACLLMLLSFLLYRKILKCENQSESLHSSTIHDANHNEYKKMSHCNIKSESENLYMQNFTQSEIHLKKNTDSHCESESSSSSAKTLILLFISGLVGCLAMLAKETGITILGINLLYDVNIEFKKTAKKNRRDLSCCMGDKPRKIENFLQRIFKTLRRPKLKQRITLLVFLILASLTFRMYLMNGSFPEFGRQDNPAAYSDSALTRLLTFLFLPVFSTWLILNPSNLSYDWQMGSISLIDNLLDYRNISTLTFYISLISLAKCAFKTERKTGKVLRVSLLFIVLPFLPASNLFFHVGFVVAERVLYTPSLGFCILVAFGVERLWDVLKCSKLVKVLTVSVLLLPLAIRTWDRNSVWKSRETLFTSGIRDNPQNAKMHYNYANLQKDLGGVEKAIEHYNIAIRLWPEYASAHNNLGTLLMNNPVVAEHQFIRAINISDGAHAGAHFNLGVLYMRQEKFSEAASHFNKSLKIDPANHQACQYFNLCISKQISQTSTQQDETLDVKHEHGGSQSKTKFGQENIATTLKAGKKIDVALRNYTLTPQPVFLNEEISGIFFKHICIWKLEKIF